MLARRQRRRANIKPALAQRIALHAGPVLGHRLSPYWVTRARSAARLQAGLYRTCTAFCVGHRSMASSEMFMLPALCEGISNLCSIEPKANVSVLCYLFCGSTIVCFYL